MDTDAFSCAVARDNFVEAGLLFQQKHASECYQYLVCGMRKSAMVHRLLSNITNESFLREVVTFKDDSGDTLLHYAVLHYDRNIVLFLLNKGASIESMNNELQSPLYFALRDGHVEMAELLLDCNAPIGSEDLHYAYFAIKAKSLSLLKRIFNEGVSPLGIFPNGKSLLHYAAYMETEVFKIYWDSFMSDDDYVEPRGESVLIVIYLLKFGVVLNLPDNDHRTPLYYAVKINNGHIIRVLLDQKPDVNSECNRDAFKLALCGAHNTKVNIVQLFFDAGFSINKAEDLKETNLYFSAAAKGFLSVVEFFFNNGTNVNSRDKSKKTALFYAVKNGQVNVAEFLLQHHAKMDCNRPGPYLLSIAAHKKLTPDNGLSYKLMKLLVEHGADVNIEYQGYTALLRAVELDNMKHELLRINKNRTEPVAKAILKQGAYVKAQDTMCGSHHAHASLRNTHVVNLLLQCGADVDIQDYNGNTPLHIAVSSLDGRSVKLLIENGSNIYIQNKKLKYPLDVSQLYLSYLSNGLIFKIFKNHIYKMELVNLFVEPKVLDKLREREHRVLHNIMRLSVDPDEPINRKQYLKEIHILRTSPIGESDVTYFKFIRAVDHHEILKYMRNKSVSQTLDAGVYRTMFPHFGYMVFGKYRKGKERLRLYKLINEHKNLFMPELTNDCVDIVLSYLNNIELRNFVYIVLPASVLKEAN